jgi:hypothetical protein
MDSEQLEVIKPVSVFTIEVKLQILVIGEDYEDASDKIDAGQGTVIDRQRTLVRSLEIPRE